MEKKFCGEREFWQGKCLKAGKKWGENDEETTKRMERVNPPGICVGIDPPYVGGELPGQLPEAAVGNGLVDGLERRLVASH